jgi:hypothetical protein
VDTAQLHVTFVKYPWYGGQNSSAVPNMATKKSDPQRSTKLYRHHPGIKCLPCVIVLYAFTTPRDDASCVAKYKILSLTTHHLCRHVSLGHVRLRRRVGASIMRCFVDNAKRFRDSKGVCVFVPCNLALGSSTTPPRLKRRIGNCPADQHKVSSKAPDTPAWTKVAEEPGSRPSGK